MTNRSFGSVRELPSGRFQARHRPTGQPAVVHAFDTEAEAEEFLAAVEQLLKRTDMTAAEIEALART